MMRYIYAGVGAVILLLGTSLYVGKNYYDNQISEREARIEVLVTNNAQLESAIASQEETINFLKKSNDEQKTALRELQVTVREIPKTQPEIITIIEETDPVVAQRIAREDMDASLNYIEQSTSPN